MKTTHNEQAAAQAGYPAMLFGYTPNQAGYWTEPGLPWVSECLQDFPNPDHIWQFVKFPTDQMAPRFRKGTTVAVERMKQAQPLPAGLYVWRAHASEGTTTHVGQLQEAHSGGGDRLQLTLDNQPQGIICLLEWYWADFCLYRVTHYSSTPAVK